MAFPSFAVETEVEDSDVYKVFCFSQDDVCSNGHYKGSLLEMVTDPGEQNLMTFV